MANPRQRNKARSSHNPVRHSRRAGAKLRKQPPIKGPKILQDAWDVKKTVRQNYAALGLAADVNRVQPAVPVPTSAVEADGMETVSGAPVESSRAGQLPKGMGRIVRDGEGNVIGVEVGESADGPVEQEEEGTVAAESQKEDSSVVRALTSFSASAPVRARRHASMHQKKWLATLVERHGEDYEGMSRDIRHNVYQHTPGQLRRMVESV